MKKSVRKDDLSPLLMPPVNMTLSPLETGHPVMKHQGRSPGWMSVPQVLGRQPTPYCISTDWPLIGSKKVLGSFSSSQKPIPEVSATNVTVFMSCSHPRLTRVWWVTCASCSLEMSLKVIDSGEMNSEGVCDKSRSVTGL